MKIIYESIEILNERQFSLAIKHLLKIFARMNSIACVRALSKVTRGLRSTLTKI